MTERELRELGQLWEMRRSGKLEERDKSVYITLLEKFYLIIVGQSVCPSTWSKRPT